MWETQASLFSLRFSVSREKEPFLDGYAPPINGKRGSMDKVRFFAGKVHGGFCDLSRAGNSASRKGLR
jgi:hypothetical protein